MSVNPPSFKTAAIQHPATITAPPKTAKVFDEAMQGDTLRTVALKPFMPCYVVKHDKWTLDDEIKKPGVWYLREIEGKQDRHVKADWICSPLTVAAITHNNGNQFGRLLDFIDTLKQRRQWAMPMRMLSGDCRELRAQLLDAGLLINNSNRERIADYIQFRQPTRFITAATKTGWTNNGLSYVLPNCIIGQQDVIYQADSLDATGTAKTGGTNEGWQTMAALCVDNPILQVSICVALAGALLAKLNTDNGGIHWIGESSIGKTTALFVGVSVWGGTDYWRTWKATGNGLEGAAAQLNDQCLFLDEINQCETREVGEIVYQLGNGIGKARAKREGTPRTPQRWSLTLMSTGEMGLEAVITSAGKQAKAGQLIRLLDVPAARDYGIFDTLHGFDDGAELSKHLKQQAAAHYGWAGVAFIEYLLKQDGAKFSPTLKALEARFTIPDNQAGRAASRFAAYAMAGELAIEAGIVPWEKGAALTACQTLYTVWLDNRGEGKTEARQILEAVRAWLIKHGELKFTDRLSTEPPRQERAGWTTIDSGQTVYMMTNAALKDAGGGYESKRVAQALTEAGWLTQQDGTRLTKKTRVNNQLFNLYWVKPTEE